MIAFVTGANGFVGRAVSRALVNAGWTVRGGIRDDSHRHALSSGVEAVVVGDLTMQPLSASTLEGADVVIHLAARTHVLRDTAREPARVYAAVNVGVTAALAKAAASAGIPRAVFMSSIKVLGERTVRPFDDASQPAPEDEYGRTKLEAEQELVSILAGTRTEWCILRPPLVFGPGVRGNFPRLVRLARIGRRLPLPFGSVANRRSLIHVEDLAQAVILAAGHPAAARQSFVVADAPPRSTPELLSAMGEALGGRVKLVPVPVALLQAAATAIGRGDEARRLLGSLEVDASRFRQVTGWKPAMDFHAAIAETVLAITAPAA